MTEQEKELKMSVFDVFEQAQETFEEAKKKSSEESRTRVAYMRFKQDGTFAVRILPLAPVINADGEVLPMERKGYEYPLRTLMFKIAGPTSDGSNKPKISYVSVCNAMHAFKDKIKADPIDTYLSRTCELHSDDEKMCKKLREGSFNGGLKWDSKRCMYVIDLDNPAEGIQILQLSYSQYRDLEERKLAIWNKLNKNGKNVPCPISSIANAYPVEIIRKTENNKASYSFNIDTLSGVDQLSDEDLKKLLDLPRLPEVLYRYTRYHLEATVAYLKQLDEQYGIDMVNDKEVQDCIEQIKLLLPADDQSHFVNGGSSSGSDKSEDSSCMTIEALWETFNNLQNEGLDDHSIEGQDLRLCIKEYIDNNDLDIRITHSKSNEDLLEAIEAELDKSNSEDKAAEEDDEEQEERQNDSKQRSRRQQESEDDDFERENDIEERSSSRRLRERSSERTSEIKEPEFQGDRRAGGRPQRRR